MEFERENCKFTIPDKPTVRQQLRYFSAAAGIDPVLRMERFWAGAVQLIEKWDCALLPDYKTDIDTLTNPDQTTVIIWAGLRVKEYMDELEEIPKN